MYILRRILEVKSQLRGFGLNLNLYSPFYQFAPIFEFPGRLLSNKVQKIKYPALFGSMFPEVH